MSMIYDENGVDVGTDEMAVSFSDEENIAIASIKPDALRPVLNDEQFAALTKLIGCVHACVFMGQGGQKQ